MDKEELILLAIFALVEMTISAFLYCISYIKKARRYGKRFTNSQPSKIARELARVNFSIAGVLSGICWLLALLVFLLCLAGGHVWFGLAYLILRPIGILILASIMSYSISFGLYRDWPKQR